MSEIKSLIRIIEKMQDQIDTQQKQIDTLLARPVAPIGEYIPIYPSYPTYPVWPYGQPAWGTGTGTEITGIETTC